MRSIVGFGSASLPYGLAARRRQGRFRFDQLDDLVEVRNAGGGSPTALANGPVDKLSPAARELYELVHQPACFSGPEFHDSLQTVAPGSRATTVIQGCCCDRRSFLRWLVRARDSCGFSKAPCSVATGSSIQPSPTHNGYPNSVSSHGRRAARDRVSAPSRQVDFADLPRLPSRRATSADVLLSYSHIP